MLISSRRRVIRRQNIELPEWVRAPLSLSSGNKVYCVLELSPSLATTVRRHVELHLSPFAHSLWGDVWRVELETEDRAGTYEKIFRFFTEHNIDVLSAEGSLAAIQNVHLMSFVVSCEHYRSTHDSSSTERRALHYCTLRDLFSDMAVEFIDTVVMNDNGLPRLKIRRIDTYHKLYRRLRDKDTLQATLKIEKDSLRIDRGIIQHLTLQLQLIDLSDLIFISTVDTKDRICLIQFHKKGPYIPFYLQMVVPRRTNFMQIIFETLKKWSCNIIKLQIREGLSNNMSNLPQFDNREAYCRVDLTFISEIPQNESTFVAELKATLLANPDLRAAGTCALGLEDYSDA
jgi:hypothetical protein